MRNIFLEDQPGIGTAYGQRAGIVATIIMVIPHISNGLVTQKFFHGRLCQGVLHGRTMYVDIGGRVRVAIMEIATGNMKQRVFFYYAIKNRVVATIVAGSYCETEGLEA